MVAMKESRIWVYELPPNTLFWASDVPGEPDYRSQVLSRMSSGNKAPLQRVARGLYWKPEKPGWPIGMYKRHYEWARALGWLAGDGGGLAGLTALNLFMWIYQSPTVSHVVSLRSPRATPGLGRVRWEVDDFEWRRGLTWAEVSFIEALRSWAADTKFNWRHVIWSIYSRDAFARLPPDYVIRSEALGKVINNEQHTPLEAFCVANGTKYTADDPPLDVRLKEAVGALKSSGL